MSWPAPTVFATNAETHGPVQPYSNAIVTPGNPLHANANLKPGVGPNLKISSNAIRLMNGSTDNQNANLTFTSNVITVDPLATLQISKLTVNTISQTTTNASNIVITNTLSNAAGATKYFGVASQSEATYGIAINQFPVNKDELVVFGQLYTEVSRASSAEASLAGAVSVEASRAASAEASLGLLAQGALSRIDNLETGNEYFSQLNVGVPGGSNGASLSINSAGDLVTNGTITSYSDMRLKTDITTLSNALEIVTHMRPVTYVWNNGHGTTNAAFPELGLIAQEVEAVMPNVVHTTSNAVLSDLKSVAYDRLVALLIGAVSELSAKVDALSK